MTLLRKSKIKYNRSYFISFPTGNIAWQKAGATGTSLYLSHVCHIQILWNLGKKPFSYLVINPCYTTPCFINPCFNTPCFINPCFINPLQVQSMFYHMPWQTRKRLLCGKLQWWTLPRDGDFFLYVPSVLVWKFFVMDPGGGGGEGGGRREIRTCTTCCLRDIKAMETVITVFYKSK